MLRAIITGPTKGKRPAALSFGGKPLTPNKDGSFSLETRQITELFGKGYDVEPIRPRSAHRDGRQFKSKSEAISAARSQAQKDAESGRLSQHPVWADAYNAEYAKWVAFYPEREAEKQAKNDYSQLDQDRRAAGRRLTARRSVPARSGYSGYVSEMCRATAGRRG